MTTGERWLALAAAVEPWLAVGLVAVMVAVGAGALGAGRPGRAGPSLDAPILPRTERMLLALLLVLAVVLRVVGWQSALTPAWWFSEVAVLPVDRMLRDGTLWAT